MQKKQLRFVVVVLFLALLGVIIYAKTRQSGKPSQAEGGPDKKTQGVAVSPLAPSFPGKPAVLDFGRGECIPCKMMKPILEELQKELAGNVEVKIIDVGEEREEADRFNISLIPTQIFVDAGGKELFRHVGFFSKEDILAKLKELGVPLDTATPPGVPKFSRPDPAAPDTRRARKVCYMCDGDVQPKTRTLLKTDRGDVVLCSPHCYFILYSSLLDVKGIDEKTSVTDWATGEGLPATSAVYLRGIDEAGRPTIKAFANKENALKEQRSSGGNLLNWQMLKEKELACRCGFCDRALYPEDTAVVRVAGVYTWGCCPMCALGVAARTQKDIEVHQKDALTGEMIRVTTMNGSVSSLEPATAVAWAGKRKGPDGKWVSTGCFKQAFFVNETNLRKWVEQHPTATGEMISIHQALAEKMKLTPEQIGKACKIGECAPKGK